MLSIRPFVSKNLVDLQRVVGANDYIIARLKRQELGGSATYTAWPSATAGDIYQYASSLPVKQRALHCVFGRTGVPMDFCADLDLPLDPNDTQKKRYGHELMVKVCEEASAVLSESFQKQFNRLVVLQSFSPKKLSYHIHARVDETTAFADFNSVGKFCRLIQAKLDKNSLHNVIDSQIYRSNGSLRLYNCVKSIGNDVTLSHVAHKYPKEWEPLPEELFDMSLVMRKLVDVKNKLEYEKGEMIEREKEVFGLDDARKQLHAVSKAVLKLSKYADDYKSWIGISLALKSCDRYVHENFADDPSLNFHDVYHAFSQLSSKYEYAQCESWWNKFRINDLDLARSVGYIMKLERQSRR